MVISDLRPVMRCAALTTSPVTTRSSVLEKGFFSQPAKEITAKAINAAKNHRELRTNVDARMSRDRRRKLFRWPAWDAAGVPRESATIAYAAFRAGSAVCKISMAFFASGSLGELEGAGKVSPAAARSSGESRTSRVGATPSTGISLPAGV